MLGREPELLEPANLGLKAVQPGQIRERRPTPERERRAQGLGRAARVTGCERAPALLVQLLEAEEVDVVRLGVEQIAGGRVSTVPILAEIAVGQRPPQP